MTDVFTWLVDNLRTERVLVVNTVSHRIEYVSTPAQPLCDDANTVTPVSPDAPTTVNLHMESSSAIKRFLHFDTSQFRLIPIATEGPLAFIIADPVLTYSDVASRFETLSTLAETVPWGISLLRLDTRTGENEYLYACRQTARFLGSTIPEMKRLGISCVGDRVPAEDRKRIDPIVGATAVNMGSYECTLRIFMDGRYTWRRGFGSCHPGDSEGVTLISIMGRKFETEAKDLFEDSTNRSAREMLSCFTSAIFDVSFHMDEHFRILDDNAKVRDFFYASQESPIGGKPMDIFIRLTDDKVRLKEYLAATQTDEDFTAPKSGIPAPTLIRLKLSLARQMTVVQLYACNLGNSTKPLFLVGIRVCDALPKLAVTSYKTGPAPPNTKSSGSGLCDIDEGESVASSEGKAEEERIAHMLKYAGLVNPLHRLVSRDLAVSLHHLSPEVACPALANWLTPVYRMCDVELMKDELLWTLPNNLQSDFVVAGFAGNYQTCGQLMSISLEGNCNFLSTLGGKRLSTNAELLYCFYRFLIGIIPRMSPEKTYAMLVTMGAARRRLKASMARAGYDMTNYEFTLALITQGILHPRWFTTESSLVWLRKAFTEALEMPLDGLEPNRLDKTRRLPSIYWMAVLWACFMKSIQRDEEASSVLITVFEDMHAYVTRHPEASTVRRLQAISDHNLVVGYMAKSDSVNGLKWLAKLREIIRTTSVDLPEACYHLARRVKRTELESYGRPTS